MQCLFLAGAVGAEAGSHTVGEALGEEPDGRVTGECCGAGPRLPPWVFGGWMVTKKSSNSLAVWPRTSLTGSKGLVNQTWHLGKPWNPWAREAAVPGGQPRQLDLLRRGRSMLPERSEPLITRPRHATSPGSTPHWGRTCATPPSLTSATVRGRNRYRKQPWSPADPLPWFPLQRAGSPREARLLFSAHAS